MTKDELYQYYYLNLEIEQLKERIAWTDSISKKCTQNIISTPKSKNNNDYIAELVDLKQCLKQKMLYCLKKRIAIENYIESIDDFEIRLIMVSRIIKGNSWRKVAFGIGRHDESYPRKQFHRFLKLSEKSE